MKLGLVLVPTVEEFSDLLDTPVRPVWKPVRPPWGPVRPLDVPV